MTMHVGFYDACQYILLGNVYAVKSEFVSFKCICKEKKRTKLYPVEIVET